MDYLIYNMADLPADVADLSLLPPEEQAEATRRGNAYAAVRTLLRRELARRTGTPAQDIQFEYTEHGKPCCALQPFNISHSGDCLCLAFHHKAIGVDVERLRPLRFRKLASRIMCERQLDDFFIHGATQADFFVCWCVAEALVKHAGDTIWNAKNYPFIYHHGRVECLFDNAPMVHLFNPLPGYQGAIACSQH